ncbi:MAG: carbohydrate-binding family 9-like protein [Bacteroidota bacterium]
MKLRGPISFLLFGLLYINAILAQADKKLVLGEQPIFSVSRTHEQITIDGRKDEVIWEKTEAGNFDHYYRAEHPDDRQQTIFRMLWDEKNLYVLFEMKDKYLTARETKRDGAPYFDDCAEVFFITAPDSLNIHFGYELNLYKAANDFIYFNRYYQEKDVVYKAFNPEYSVETSSSGTINDNSDIDEGWFLEMAIPIANFGELGQTVPVKKGNRWAFLAIRQDRNDAEGNRRSTSTLFPIYDISKNVHQPHRFGLLEFTD